VNYILKGEMVRGEGMGMMVRLLQVATFNHEGVCLAKLEALTPLPSPQCGVSKQKSPHVACMAY